MKIGVIRECKVPSDSRAPLTPSQCVEVRRRGFEILVQPSLGRCFSNEEYAAAGIPLTEDMTQCDILLGVKEVPPHCLIPEKTFFFFSHTIKKQKHNQRMLQEILNLGIRLIDYEMLTNEAGQRVIAFGRFAGMVGAHNALWTYGMRSRLFELPRMRDLRDYQEAVEVYQTLDWPPVRIVLTGTGRVGQGAAKVLRDMGMKGVAPEEYLSQNFPTPVFTQLGCRDYARRKDGSAFKKEDFFSHPEWFESKFDAFAARSDIMINGIFWDKRAPAFFTVEQMASPKFKIQVIADVTCDIAPESSIPSTLKASTIADPVFGFDPLSAQAVDPFQAHAVDMMTIDNLPNELPRDASEAFGSQFLEHVLDHLWNPDESPILKRAMLTDQGQLTPPFKYLDGYVHELKDIQR